MRVLYGNDSTVKKNKPKRNDWQANSSYRVMKWNNVWENGRKEKKNIYFYELNSNNNKSMQTSILCLLFMFNAMATKSIR